MASDRTIVKPFIRWAGGKRWLLKYIDQLLPSCFNNYHEPFLGGGSIFLYLKNTNKIQNQSFLSDSNEDLINTYKVLKSNSYELIKILETYNNEKDFYYSIRSLNPTSSIERAAQFIYLNKTSYNGIYRVNRQGQYNVPFGYRKNKDLFDFENMKKCSQLFDDLTALYAEDFDFVKNNIQRSDLIFLDPPYTVAHENNGFVQYNQHIFSWEDQKRLAVLLEFITNAEAYFILTNAAHISISNLFSGLGTLQILQRHSTIGGKGAKRNSVNEYVFTNIR